MRESGRKVSPVANELEEEDSWSSSVEDHAMSTFKGMESVLEHVQVLVSQEGNGYAVCKDYLSIPQGALSSDAVSEAWRRKLCEWCYEVVDHFGFDREAVAIALSYLDRMVASKTEASADPIQKRDFQLIAVTSLYVALKLHGETDATEGPRRKLRIDAFVELSRGFFHVDVIENMELNLLSSLKWRVNPPTSVKFIGCLLRLCPKWSIAEHSSPRTAVMGGMYDVARYLAELSVCVSSFSFTCKASMVGYASILCAIEALQDSLPLPYQVRVTFLKNIAIATGMYPQDLEVRRVCKMLKDLAPNMFEGDEILAEFLVDRTNEYSNHHQSLSLDDGKASPVCVVDRSVRSTPPEPQPAQRPAPPQQRDESPGTRRKRSRASSEEAAHPIHRSSS